MPNEFTRAKPNITVGNGELMFGKDGEIICLRCNDSKIQYVPEAPTKPEETSGSLAFQGVIKATMHLGVAASGAVTAVAQLCRTLESLEQHARARAKLRRIARDN